VALGVGVWLVWPQPSAITRENYECIQTGMTRADVEAILGGPARDETTGRCRGQYEEDSTILIWFPHSTSWHWIGPECAVAVVLDEEDRVVLKHLGQSVPRDASTLAWLRRLLRL
jgi:hypothetical protein